MAAGSAVTAENATAGSGTWTIQPGAGAEWIIHTLAWTGPCNVTITDGANPVIFFQAATSNSMLSNLQLHLTNAQYLIMTDTSGATNNMSYSGIQTV
jgi:hypothetical protein